MALLLCPECYEKISDKNPRCIHCGYPINLESKEMLCSINGIIYNMKYFYNDIISSKLDTDKCIKLANDFRKLTNCSCAVEFIDMVLETKQIPHEFNRPTIDSIIEKQQVLDASKIHCPYCKSTNVKKISTTQRAASVIGLGIISNKIGKTYQCKNCKSTW